MKRKMGVVALMGCFSLTIAGCEANTDDLNKQLTKMNELIEDGDIFDDDYQIKGEMIVSNDGKTSSIKYHLEKDDDKFWVKLETQEEGKEKYFESWIGEEDDDKYYAFYDDNGENKTYMVIDEDNVNDTVDDVIGGINGVDADLEKTYNSLKESFERALEVCGKENETLSCTIEKSLFGTVTLTGKTSMLGVVTETSYSIRGGKIRKIVSTMNQGDYNIDLTIKYSYGNQIVRFPKVDDFKKI